MYGMVDVCDGYLAAEACMVWYVVNKKGLYAILARSPTAHYYYYYLKTVFFLNYGEDPETTHNTHTHNRVLASVHNDVF